MTTEGATSKSHSVSSAAVTDEGGACLKAWRVAYTRVNYERRAADVIARMGHETYVPVQREMHQWSDRRKMVSRVVIPMCVFVRTDAAGAAAIERLSFVSHFLRIPGERRIAIVPDEQLAVFRFMIENAERPVTMEPISVHTGDHVRLVRGHLRGMTGFVSRHKGGETRIAIVLDHLGCASVVVDADDLALINPPL